jgi:hypothetical protein
MSLLNVHMNILTLGEPGNSRSATRHLTTLKHNCCNLWKHLMKHLEEPYCNTKGNVSNKLNCLLHHETTGYCSIENTHLGLHLHLDQKKTAIATISTYYLGHLVIVAATSKNKSRYSSYLGKNISIMCTKKDESL